LWQVKEKIHIANFGTPSHDVILIIFYGSIYSTPKRVYEPIRRKKR